MRRLLNILASLVLAISLVAGAASHAAELKICVTADVADSCIELSGKQGEPPAGNDKALGHHHGCHGHHIGVPINSTPIAVAASVSRIAPLRCDSGIGNLAPKGMFRPPIA